ncbi:Protein kinase, putative [Hondaea fermentalgiana]|uniref:Protein kinase, putative n=1 Tax=Hondaea fermentalgiana TaxID=2315210 RepID=A0A2R5GFA4_9STRA|nr:Protein kinase, putative [Hondaea fermentalgiana]|eukprot:GBG28418.1 Protein kinase, putative [Hondaea fermentalgiana]
MLHAKTRAEDFEPLRIVGTGGSGQVYLVQHRQTCKRFAMKVLNKAEVIASNKFERVITEREILTRASSQESSFLTRLNFAFHSDNMLFFVMEYCTGGNLHEAMLREHEIRKPTMDKERYRLAMDAAAEGQGLIGSLAFIRYFDRANFRRRGPRDILLRFGLAPVHVQFIMAEIIEGLMFLHSAGFVYRDLKPQNVMLHGDGHIRIGDFGISKAGQNKGNAVVKLRSTSFVGTVEYMAPEVVSGDQQSNAVDLWGLGVLLYELLLGAPPFWALGVGASVPSEAEQRQLFAAILSPETHLDFPLSGQISIVAQDLVKRWMRRRPGERLGLEAAKKHAFFNGLNWRSLKNSSGFHKLMPRLHIHRKDRKAVSLARSTSNNIFVANALSAGDIFSESLVQDGEQGRPRDGAGSAATDTSSSESKMHGTKDGHLVHVSAQDSFQGFDWKADGS